MVRVTRPVRLIVGLCAAGVLLVVAVTVDLLPYLDQMSSVGSFVLAFWAAKTSLAANDRAQGTDDPLVGPARRLAAVVGTQLDKEATWRGLNRSRPLRIRWKPASPSLGADPAGVFGVSTGQRHRVIRGEVREAAAGFRALRDRQVVLLGDAGAGKTVLALQLALELLATPLPGEPVPVMLPLSQWRPSAPGEPIGRWVARCLRDDFAVGGSADRRLADQLVASSRVLPILDGLDEVPTAYRADALRAINEEIWSGRPLIVTCRTDDYETFVKHAGFGLATAAAVTLEPIERAEAWMYLAGTGGPAADRWKEVFTANPPPVALDALQSPLYLGLARTIYSCSDADPGELLNRSRFPAKQEVEQHLLASFLPSVYRKGPESAGFVPAPVRPDRALRWHRALAHHVGNPDIAWWRLRDTVPAAARLVSAGLVSGVLSGSLGFVVYLATSCLYWSAQLGVAVNPVLVADQFVKFGVRVGLLSGILTAVVVALQRRSPRPSRRFAGRPAQRLRVFFHDWKQAMPFGAWGIAALLLVVAGNAAAPVWAIHHVGGNAAPILWAYVVLLALAAVTASVIFLLIPAGFEEVTGPRELLSADRQGAAARALAYGLLLTILLGILFANEPYYRITFAPALGVALGTATALASTAWGHWLLCTRIWLPVNRKLPWRIMRFLEDAHRRGVLRQAAAHYRYRHDRLHEFLSTTGSG